MYNPNKIKQKLKSAKMVKIRIPTFCSSGKIFSFSRN